MSKHYDIETAENMFDQNYKDKVLSNGVAETNEYFLQLRAYEFQVDPKDLSSRKDFAKFMLHAIGLGYAQATEPIVIPGSETDSVRFVQVYLQRASLLEAGQRSDPRPPEPFVMPPKPRQRSGLKPTR